MKILFKNTTEYNKENYNDFVKFHQEKFGMKTLIKIGIIFLCFLYIIIMNLIYKNLKVIGIVLIAGVIFYGLYKLQVTEQIKDRKKNIKNKKKFTFYFYENYIKIKCGRKFQRIIYLELYKIFQTDENFLLYTDENHSLIISKSGFEIGTPNEFDLFIKKKCPLKYKKK